jgi:hypothetical protein
LRFDDCWTRLERADAHREALVALWDQFIEAGSHRARCRVELDGTGVMWIECEPIPETFSLTLGEMLYQLRSALDASVYAAAVLETGENPPPRAGRLAFPIYTEPATFASRSPRDLGTLGNAQRSFIEEVQPYNAGSRDEIMRSCNEALGVLNRWSRIDRHRRLHVMSSWLVEADPQLRVPRGVTVLEIAPEQAGVMGAEHPVARFRLRGWRRGLQVYGNPFASIGLAVSEPDSSSADPAEDLIRWSAAMPAAVTYVVAKLAASYGEPMPTGYAA